MIVNNLIIIISIIFYYRK